MPDFTSSQKIPSASVLYAQCSSARNLVQTFHLLYKNSASTLSQLHLSIFTDPTQRARVYMTLESQNRGLWQTLPQSIQRLRKVPSLRWEQQISSRSCCAASVDCQRS